MYVCMYVAAFKLLIDRMNRQWQWLEDGIINTFVYFNITHINRHDTLEKVRVPTLVDNTTVKEHLPSDVLRPTISEATML